MINARFKSLANIWANRRQVEDRLGVVYVFTEEALQVYAEQIVKECAQQITEAIPETNCSASGAYRTVKLAVLSRIKEHFGVEE